MLTRLRGAVVFTGVILFLSSASQAATIAYETAQVTGSTWQFSYTITNDSLGAPLREFTVFFDRNLYSGLSVAGSPGGWDSIVVQRDLGLPADGYFDSLISAPGLAVAATQGGFTAQFTWLGSGTPGAQSFTIVDPVTFQTLESGTTTTVPLPGTVGLLGWALGLVGYRVRRRIAGGESRV